MTECDCNNKNISIRHEKRNIFKLFKNNKTTIQNLLNSDQSTRIEIYIYIYIYKKAYFN